MLVHLSFFILGLIILYFGAEWMVGGSSRLALYFGIQPLVVGLTIVALGTSLPEFLVNLFAVIAREDSIAVGNIIGSNISNIALILGMVAVLAPLRIARNTLHREYLIMMVVLLTFAGLASDGVIQRHDGAILVVGLVAFLGYLFYSNQGRPSMIEEEWAEQAEYDAISLPWQSGRIVLGMAGLGLGAHLMVDHAVAIAKIYNISEVVIGLTIVAIGTSLPELAASVVGAVKHEDGLSIGNILGSNILNVLFVIGAVSSIQPLGVDAESVRIHLPFMVAVGGLLYVLARPSFKLGRAGGVALLLLFGGYMAFLLLPYV
ncbi:sodium:proton exchanger [Longimonas halophila]|uniref:Sodium:proton exchanger n=1 Tax=Longimonas halophila TaxID=1469170 RepID=A0A2H3NPE6_9BACT|nr:calcium/sodium antiporter [Longimonas halophila]PEN06999.1 sodium:proton exchanger [Longimonas halophila]